MDNKLPKLPKRNATGNKSSFGSLAVVGGHLGQSDVMFGGTALAAMGALRIGVGKCVLTMPEDVLKNAISIIPQAVGFELRQDSLTAFKELIEQKVQAVVIGPALGNDELQKNALDIVMRSKNPVVIDADAINIIVKNPSMPIARNSIITPQSAEFERLKNAFGVAGNDKEASNSLAKKLGCVLVLKNAITYITNGDYDYELNMPNPVLAAAGSGDLLAGIIGGLLAQYFPKDLSLMQIAILGVNIHARTAELWKQKHGDRGVIISELAELIPESISNLPD